MNNIVAIVMHNTVCVVAFVLLAIAFKHWWLVFFALIFFHSAQSQDEEKK